MVTEIKQENQLLNEENLRLRKLLQKFEMMDENHEAGSSWESHDASSAANKSKLCSNDEENSCKWLLKRSVRAIP